MTDLSGIITLLQLVLVLLGNPSTSQNPQVISLASQSVQYATQALSVSVTQTIKDVVPERDTNMGIPIPISESISSTTIVTDPMQCGVNISLRKSSQEELREGNNDVIWTVSWVLSGNKFADNSTGTLYFADDNNFHIFLPPISPWGKRMTRFNSEGFPFGKYIAKFGETECSTYVPNI